MTEVLSKDEIDQLLAAINAGGNDPEYFKPVKNTRKIKIYDFRRPDMFTNEQIILISMIYESFSRELSAILSDCLRKNVQVYVSSVDKLTCEEYIRSLPSHAIISVIEVAPLQGGWILEIEPIIAHTIINRLFGGDGGKIGDRIGLTALESKVIHDYASNTMINPLRNAWSEIVSINPVLGKIETTPGGFYGIPPEEMMALVTLECRTDETEGKINFCLPCHNIRPVFGKTGQISDDTIELHKALDKIKIPVTVELGRAAVKLSSLKKMCEGTIFELDKLAGEPVDILSDNTRIGGGEVVVIDGKFAVRVTGIAGSHDE